MQAQVGKGLSRLSESGNGTSIQTLGPMQSPGDSSIMKKRRKRRRKSKVDSMKREDNGDFSEDEDMFTIDMSSDDDTVATGSRSEQTVWRKFFNWRNIIMHIKFHIDLSLYDFFSSMEHKSRNFENLCHFFPYQGLSSTKIEKKQK